VPWPFDYSEDVIYAIARNPGDATDLIRESTQPFDLWIFDHDLGSDWINGYQFLKKMIDEQPGKLPTYVLSCSANREGKENIEALWRNYQRMKEEE
jgi:hypothetical protein